MRPLLWLPVLGAPLAVVGALGFGLGRDGRAATSFLGGLALALVVVAAGVWFVEYASRLVPRYGLLFAMTQYVVTVLFFLLLLKAVDRDSVDVPAFATGLAASVVPYLAWQFASARVGQDHS